MYPSHWDPLYPDYWRYNTLLGQRTTQTDHELAQINTTVNLRQARPPEQVMRAVQLSKENVHVSRLMTITRTPSPEKPVEKLTERSATGANAKALPAVGPRKRSFATENLTNGAQAAFKIPKSENSTIIKPSSTRESLFIDLTEDNDSRSRSLSPAYHAPSVFQRPPRKALADVTNGFPGNHNKRTTAKASSSTTRKRPRFCESTTKAFEKVHTKLDQCRQMIKTDLEALSKRWESDRALHDENVMSDLSELSGQMKNADKELRAGIETVERLLPFYDRLLPFQSRRDMMRVLPFRTGRKW